MDGPMGWHGAPIAATRRIIRVAAIFKTVRSAVGWGIFALQHPVIYIIMVRGVSNKQWIADYYATSI
jgi:hypothetical protein